MAGAKKGKKRGSKASEAQAAPLAASGKAKAAASGKAKAASAQECLPKEERHHDGPSASTLPSAVLVQVLSWLPVADLLRAAQVCRRWRALAARPEAWRCTDVVMTSGNCKQQVWLLERAPQLRLLDMSGLSTADDFGFQDDQAVWDAWERLDSMDCPAQQLDIRVERDSCAKIALLEKWGPKLRRLQLRLGTWFSQCGREYGQLHLAIKTVGSKMSQLTHLDLTYELHKGAHGGYDRELGKGCPALVSFTFHFPTVQDYKHWKEVVLDVLTHKSGQLTELALFASDKCPEVPAELWPAIGRCTQLRRLAVPTPPGLAVVGQLPLLRDLSLQPSKNAYLSKKTRETLLADHAVLGALQRLELQLSLPVRGTPDRMPALLDELLSRTCSEVRCLSLTGGCFPAAVLAGLLGDVARMPALAELRLRAVGGIEAGHLDLIAASGRLKVVCLQDISMKLEATLESSLSTLRRSLHLKIQ